MSVEFSKQKCTLQKYTGNIDQALYVKIVNKTINLICFSVFGLSLIQSDCKIVRANVSRMSETEEVQPMDTDNDENSENLENLIPRKRRR